MKFFTKIAANKRKSVSFSFRVLMMVVLCAGVEKGWGQSYLGLDGGLEGTAIVDATFGASAPSAGNGKWTTAGSSATQSAIAVETGTVRSGAKSLKISGTNTSLARVWTPAFTIPSTSSKFFVQYYRRSASTTNTQTAQIGVIRGGTEQLNGTYTLVSAINTWEKVTYAPGAVTTVTSVAGVIGNKSNNATGGDVFIDDFVIYADVAVDNAAPNSPGTVTATPNGPNPTTKLDVSWLAASGGVDNGGYMVVRYTTSPASSDDPNVNGIYATNNTISGTVTGTVVYVGTSLSFTDNSLSPGATYYYKVYTYDKAYNYSAETNGSGTTTSGTAATQLVITAINGGSTVTAGSAFSATVQARDGSNLPANVTANTDFSLSLATGTGSLSGTLTGTILAGTSSITVTGILYNTAETGVSITATRTSGDILTAGTSSTFTVFSAEPTAQPTGFTRLAVSTGGMTIGWTAATGSPTGYIVLRTTASGTTFPNTAPLDGTTYSAAGTLGNATVEYVGNSLSAAIASLSPLLQYSYSIYSYNGSGTTINYYTSSPLQGQPFTLATEPTQQSTSVTATSVTATTLTLNWSGENGNSTLIVAKAGSAVDFVPTDGVNYSSFINPAFGSGTAVGAGNDNYILGSTSLSTLNITALTANTTYYFAAYTYNGFNASSSDNFFATPGTASQLTLVAPPTAQPTGLTFGSVTAVSFTVSFTAAAGNPTGYIVLRNAGSVPTGTPLGGTVYTAGNTNIGGGTNTVAYVGPTPSPNFAESGLAEGTTYYYAVYSYNGSGTSISYYTTSPLTGNQATTALPVPTATAATSVTNSSFNANWGSVVGATNYKLDVSTSNTFMGSPTTFGSDGFENSLSIFTQTTGAGAFYSGNSGSGDRPATSPFAVAGTYAFGKSGGSVTITSSDINTSGASNTQLSFRLAAFSVTSNGNGMEAGDIVTVEISPDGGANYYSTVRVLGNTNACWAYSSGSGVASTAYDGDPTPSDFQPTGGGLRTTDGYSTVTVTSLPASSNLRIRITLLNNDAAERWLVDNLSVTGTPGSFVAGYQNLTVNGVSQAVTGLTASTAYYYRVRTVGTNSTSSNSNVISVTTYAVPTITSFTPSSGYLGTSVVITGTDFTDATAVAFGGTNAASFVVNSNTQITAIVGAGSTGTVAVTTPGGTATSAGTFTYGGYITTQAGDWNTGSTWLGGNVPPGGATVTVAHNVTTATANPLTNSGSVTVNTGASLAIGDNYNNTGSTTINGSFQLNNGGYTSGVDFVYGGSSTLVFNTSGSYGVNTSDAYWPNSGGPVNVTVAGSGGITMNTGRSVSGIFQTASGVINGGNLTFNGTAKLNTGGYFSGSPNYGSSSSLIYNTGSGTPYGRGAEWNASSGAGFPHNVQISNNTTLDYPNGSNPGAQSMGGSLTIDAGSSFYMDYGSHNTDGALTVAGSVTVNGNLSLGDAVGGDLNVGGDWTFNTGATLNLNTRAIQFNSGSSAQTIGGTQSTAFAYLNMLGAGTKTFESNCSLTDALSITTGSGTIDFDGTGNNKVFTLRSTSSKTARIGNTNGTTLNGNVTVERYIPGRRAWKLLTAPVRNAGSIWSNWQNGGSVNGSTGVNIWGPSGTNPIPGANGLNQGPQYSMKQYNPGANNWSNTTTNTVSTSLSSNSGTNNGGAADNKAFLLFVTNPYDASGTNIVPPGSALTTLSARGTLQQGDQTFPVSGSDAFTLVGNPYASPVDFSLLIDGNSGVIQDRFWLFDATQSTLGAYQLVYRSGGSYLIAPAPFTGGSSAGDYVHIQSGQAVFVEPSGGGNMTFKETYKSSPLSSPPIYKMTLAQPQSLAVNMYNGSQMLDGAVMLYDSQFSAAIVASEDVKKVYNDGANVAVARNNKGYIIEARPEITSKDTSFLWISNTQANQNYTFSFKADQFNPLISAWLEDAYTGAKTSIDLSGAVNNINFSTTSDAASQHYARFQIVYQASAAPLPISFTDVKAYETAGSSGQNGAIKVEWKVNAELNADHYEVEYSTDGTHFNKLGSVNASGNNSSTVAYGYLHLTPAAGMNYYRIKLLEKSGGSKYSIIVKVAIATKGAPGIVIYPNPVINSQTALQLHNLPSGNYDVRIISNDGQLISRETINHNGGTVSRQLSLPVLTASGVYRVQVTAPDKNTYTTTITIQ